MVSLHHGMSNTSYQNVLDFCESYIFFSKLQFQYELIFFTVDYLNAAVILDELTINFPT